MLASIRNFGAAILWILLMPSKRNRSSMIQFSLAANANPTRLVMKSSHAPKKATVALSMSRSRQRRRLLAKRRIRAVMVVVARTKMVGIRFRTISSTDSNWTKVQMKSLYQRSSGTGRTHSQAPKCQDLTMNLVITCVEITPLPTRNP